LTPCCSTSFCDDCVHNALVDNDMLCPECETRIKNVDKLTADEGRRERVKGYIEEMVEASKEEVVMEVVAEVNEEERVKGEDVKKEEGAEEGAAEEVKADVKAEPDELFPVIKEEVSSISLVSPPLRCRQRASSVIHSP
jgi:protein MPE1